MWNYLIKALVFLCFKYVYTHISIYWNMPIFPRHYNFIITSSIVIIELIIEYIIKYILYAKHHVGSYRWYKRQEHNILILNSVPLSWVLIMYYILQADEELKSNRMNLIILSNTRNKVSVNKTKATAKWDDGIVYQCK